MANYVIFFDGKKEWQIPIVRHDTELSSYYEEFKKAGKPFIYIKRIGKTVKYKIDFDLSDTAHSELTNDALNKLEKIIKYYISESAKISKKWRDSFEYSIYNRHGYVIVHAKFKEKATIEIASIIFDESNWRRHIL